MRISDWSSDVCSSDLDSDPASEPVETRDLHEDIANGVWQISGPLAWDRRYYQFEVSVFAPSTGKIEVNRVTDPYSLSLAADSMRSQFVDLDADDLKPRGWDHQIGRASCRERVCQYV